MNNIAIYKIQNIFQIWMEKKKKKNNIGKSFKVKSVTS